MLLNPEKKRTTFFYYPACRTRGGWSPSMYDEHTGFVYLCWNDEGLHWLETKNRLKHPAWIEIINFELVFLCSMHDKKKICRVINTHRNAIIREISYDVQKTVLLLRTIEQIESHKTDISGWPEYFADEIISTIYPFENRLRVLLNLLQIYASKADNRSKMIVNDKLEKIHSLWYFWHRLPYRRLTTILSFAFRPHPKGALERKIIKIDFFKRYSTRFRNQRIRKRKNNQRIVKWNPVWSFRQRLMQHTKNRSIGFFDNIHVFDLAYFDIICITHNSIESVPIMNTLWSDFFQDTAEIRLGFHTGYFNGICFNINDNLFVYYENPVVGCSKQLHILRDSKIKLIQT